MKRNAKRKLNSRVISLAIAGLVLSGLAAQAVGSRSARDGRREEARAMGQPILAVVSLGDQRITIYDARGKILQAPVSSGQTGYETPAGIYSIVQKKESHYSNLYEDGQMPFMQRITWTGIALHAGVLPGHPASHGCVRLPLAFARQLFTVTRTGGAVHVLDQSPAPQEALAMVRGNATYAGMGGPLEDVPAGTN